MRSKNSLQTARPLASLKLTSSQAVVKMKTLRSCSRGDENLVHLECIAQKLDGIRAQDWEVRTARNCCKHFRPGRQLTSVPSKKHRELSAMDSFIVDGPYAEANRADCIRAPRLPQKPLEAKIHMDYSFPNGSGDRVSEGISYSAILIAHRRSPSRFIELSFASSGHLVRDKFRMTTLIFMGGLWAVLAGIDAIVSTAGDQCAVCKPCKAIIC
jgi:hypothetical protein